MKEEMLLREEMIQVCRRLNQRGYIAAYDGNVSCRLDRKLLLVTPSGCPKGELKPLDLLVVDLKGNVVCGQSLPSSEVKMHLFVYKKRPDVAAIVHAHPPMLTAFTLAGLPFASDVFPEVWLGVGPVPTASYATPSTMDVVRSISPYIEKHQAVLLERHGSLTVGKSLEEAYMRLEKMEHAARTLFFAHLLGGGGPSPLSEKAIKKLEMVWTKRPTTS